MSTPSSSSTPSTSLTRHIPWFPSESVSHLTHKYLECRSSVSFQANMPMFLLQVGTQGVFFWLGCTWGLVLLDGVYGAPFPSPRLLLACLLGSMTQLGALQYESLCGLDEIFDSLFLIY